jgi:hypothetical protein
MQMLFRMFRLIFLRHEAQYEDDNERNYQTIKHPNLPPERFGSSFPVHVGMVRQSSSGEGNRVNSYFGEARHSGARFRFGPAQ